MALVTVQDFIDRCRQLLLDKVAPFRYSDDSLVSGLNDAILEARRIRPDLLAAYFNTAIPQYSAAAPTATVFIDQMYRSAFVYYMCGQAQLRDDENNEDARATIFLNKFTSQLLTIQA